MRGEGAGVGCYGYNILPVFSRIASFMSTPGGGVAHKFMQAISTGGGHHYNEIIIYSYVASFQLLIL